MTMPEVQNTSLAACFVVCGYLSYLSFTSPNPPPKTPYTKDRLDRTMSNLSLRRNLLGCLWCYHTVLILFPDHGSTICMNPDLLRRDLFSWSPYTISFIALTFLAAPIICWPMLSLEKTSPSSSPNRPGSSRLGCIATCNTLLMHRCS